MKRLIAPLLLDTTLLATAAENLISHGVFETNKGWPTNADATWQTEESGNHFLRALAWKPFETKKLR